MEKTSDDVSEIFMLNDLALFNGINKLTFTFSPAELIAETKDIDSTVAASATFGVYLIHDNNLVRPFLWRVVFKNASFQNSPYLIPYSIGVVILVYVACTAIEILRSKIFKIISCSKLS